MQVLKYKSDIRMKIIIIFFQLESVGEKKLFYKW